MFVMEAETINCPMCGAATDSESPSCSFCGARLATVACPKCFAMMFVGSKHCPHCGAAAAPDQEIVAEGKVCPRCRSELAIITLGDASMLECTKCLGLWLSHSTFEKICTDREEQSVVLGTASLHALEHHTNTVKVSYIPCPDCRQLMNRANFARCSGVIVDLCKAHGIWFDCDELTNIIEFIQEGGMERARAKEKAELDEERRQLRQDQLELDHERATMLRSSDTRLSGIASAGSILKLLGVK